MSLISNEIHILDGFNKTVLVFAADRRITRDGKYHATLPKLFPIPYLRAGISYFGVAEVSSSKRGRQDMAQWLPDFINQQPGTKDLKTFAGELRNSLNQVVPPHVLAAQPSGFHLCGYNPQGIPEFWFITNVGGMDHLNYTGLGSRFLEPSPDFLERDAKTQGWDGVKPGSVRNAVQVYRNGDIRAHVSAWRELDNFLREMRKYADFRQLRTVDDFAEAAKFKMEVIAYLYKKFCRKSIIGRPIDAFALAHNFP